MLALRKAYDADIQQRSEASALPAEGVSVAAHDMSQGVVFERNGVKVGEWAP